MKSTFFAAATLLLCLLIACDRNDRNKEQTLDKMAMDMKAIEKDQSGYFAADSTGRTDQEKNQPQRARQPVPVPDWDKKIIKDATLELEVKDGNSYYKNLRDQVKNLGGYIAGEEQTETGYKLENSLVIKVPVDQFDAAVAVLSDKVEKVHQRKISSMDVTGEIVDTRSRLEAKKQVRIRYLELLNQARNMSDILNVQSEINSIQEEIESATGRIQYLGHAAAFSTIRLTYFQVLNEKAAENGNLSFGNRLLQSFSLGIKWVAELFIGLVTIWPLLLAGFVIAMLVRKKVRSTKLEVRKA